MNINRLTDILSPVDKIIKSGSASNNTCTCTSQHSDIPMRHWTKSGRFNLENSCLLRWDAAVWSVVPDVTKKSSAFETSGILIQRHNAMLWKTWCLRNIGV